MEKIVIHRRGSFIYTKAYRGVVVALTLVYAAMGAAMAVISARVLERALVGVIIFALVLALIALMWLVYGAILWIFARESRQGVEISEEGIRETRDGREEVFIPWRGVTEIEVAATVVAGASLRVKGNFSEISISNVDLKIDRPMRVSQMHKALGQTAEMRELLKKLKEAAPHAEVRMNRLARRWIKKYQWAQSS